MKKILCFILLAGALCVAPLAFAAESSSSKKTGGEESPSGEIAKASDKSGEAASTEEGESAMDTGLGFKGDFPFELMRADSIEIDPAGLTVLTTKVRIESKEFNISCDQVKMDNKTKMVYATGNPVTLEQGKTVQARCRNLVYNLTTKSATLENEASIIQDQGNGQKMQATADMIKIDSDGKPGSQPKVSLLMKPGSGKAPEIRQVGVARSGDGKSKGGSATKINETNMGAIKMPALKNPVVD